MAGVEFDDREFQAALPGAFSDWQKQVQIRERDRAIQVRDSARRNAPRLTGDLSARIVMIEGHDDKGWYADVGVSSEYVHYAIDQEYGTSTMHAHPYMRPAIEENSH